MAEEEKKLLGSEFKEKLLSKISDVGQSISQRAQEDDPDSWSDEAARLAVGTAQTAGAIAGAPVIKETLSVLDFPFYMLRQSAGAVMEHGFGVDPWYGQTAVGVGEVFAGGKGLVTGAKKLKKAKMLDIAKRNDVKMHMVNYIDSTADIVPTANPSLDELLDIQRQVKYPPLKIVRGSEVPQSVRTAFRTDLGMALGDDGLIDYIAMKERYKTSPTGGRLAIEAIETPTVRGTKRSRGRHIPPKDVKRIRDSYAEEFDLDKIGIKKEEIQIHHDLALKSSVGILDGLKYNSPLYHDTIEVFLKEMVETGNMKKNLRWVFGRSTHKGTPHYLVHKYYEDVIGLSGEKWFTPEVLKQMRHSPEFRLDLARELAKEAKRSKAIVAQAMDTIKIVHSKKLNISEAEDLVERLSKFDNDGYIKTIGKQYQVPNMEQLIRDIQFQDLMERIDIPAKKITNPDALHALRIAVESGQSSVKARRTQLEEKFGKQLTFVFDEMTPEKFQAIERLYGRAGKGGTKL